MQLLSPDEINNYRDIGVVGISFIVLAYAKYMLDKSAKEVKEANQAVHAANEKFRDFIETAYKENTKVISELLNSFKEHTRLKDQAIELLRKQHDQTLNLVQEQHELLVRDRDMLLDREMQYRKRI